MVQKHHPNKFYINCLEALELYLKYDEPSTLRSNKDYLESIGGYEALNELLNHPNYEIYNIVTLILEKYFRGDSDEDVENVFSQKYQGTSGHVFDDEEYAKHKLNE